MMEWLGEQHWQQSRIVAVALQQGSGEDFRNREDCTLPAFSYKGAEPI